MSSAEIIETNTTTFLRRTIHTEGAHQKTSDEILLAAQAPLTYRAIELGLAGNSSMLKLCLERIAVLNTERKPVALPAIRSMDDALEALALITQACANGVIPVSDGEALARLVGGTATALKDVDLVRRVEVLEGDR